MRRLIYICSLVSLFAGCNHKTTHQAQHEQLELQNHKLKSSLDSLEREVNQFDSEHQKEINNINESVSKLRSKLSDLETSLAGLQNRISTLEEPNNSTKVRLDSTDFSSVSTSVGNLLISCQSADTFRNGFKIRLRVGNPNYATLRGLTINVRLMRIRQQEDGTVLGKDDFPKSDWENQALAQIGYERYLQKDVIELSSTFLPGSWTDIEVIVSPAKAADLDELFLAFTTKTVSLAK